MPNKKQLKIDNALLAAELERIREREKAIAKWVRSLKKGTWTPDYELTYLDDKDIEDDIDRLVEKGST